MPSLRELSKEQITSPERGIEVVNAGSLLRIADAAEKMASNFTQLQRDVECYKRANKEAREAIQKWKHSHTALKGVVTKRENQIADLIRQLNEAREELAASKGAA